MFLTCVTDIKAFFKHPDARMEYCGAVLHTSTTVEVRRSAHADSLVEVEAVAITDQQQGAVVAMAFVHGLARDQQRTQAVRAQTQQVYCQGQ